MSKTTTSARIRSNGTVVEVVDETEVAKALIQEYLSARQEVLLHVQLYKTQERYGALLIALTGVLIPLLFGNTIPLPIVGQSLQLTPMTVLVILFMSSSVMFHMYFSTLANLFALQVLAARCERLEEEINNRLCGPFFVWKRLTKRIWSKKGIRLYEMPDKAAGLISYLLVIVIGVILPLFALAKILCGMQWWQLEIAVTVYTWYLFALLVISGTNLIGVRNVREKCSQLFQAELAGTDPPRSPSGKLALLTITVAAGALASVFVAMILYTGACQCFFWRISQV